MPELAGARLPLLVHAELTGPVATETPTTPLEARSYSRYLGSRPREWEHAAIRLLISLCRETGCRVHIVHLSSADALPMIAQARGEGLPLFVETCPHYLFFAAEEIPDGDPRYKCAPPIRESENRDRLWEGLRDGLIDTIGTDHSPAPRELKHLETGDLHRAWGGIASLQIRSSGRVDAGMPARDFYRQSRELDGAPAGRAAGLLGLEGSNRRGPRCRSGCVRPRCHLCRRPGKPSRPAPAHALRRQAADRPRRDDVLERQPGLSGGIFREFQPGPAVVTKAGGMFS